MKSRDKLIFFLVLVLVFFWFLYSIKSILIPFVAALVTAYFLNPLVGLMQKHGSSRISSSSTITATFIFLIAITFIIFVPLIYGQFINMADVLPGYVDIILSDFYPKIVISMNHIGINLDSDLRNYLNLDNIKMIDIFGNIMTSSIAVINILSLFFITPILTFYLLKDWDRLIRKINDLLPYSYATTIRKVGAEIDKTLSGFLRGQMNVCIIAGIIYAALLSLIGLDFGLLIGLLIGFLCFMPYVGALIGISLAVVVGLFQWGSDITHLGFLSLALLVGQTIESNFLTPKLIGKKIGLHPIWMIFGLFVFGSLFGIKGVLFASPLTAISGVLIKLLVGEYKKNFVR